MPEAQAGKVWHVSNLFRIPEQEKFAETLCRASFADKVPDVANIAAGALVFGQFIGGQHYSLPVAVFGAVIWLVFFGWSLFLSRERRR